MIKVKSVYSKPVPADGKRYLVDLFWPEGIHTRTAQIDEWFSDLGPSYDLQRFEFDRNAWGNYKSKYEDEVLHDASKKERLQKIAQEARDATITLIYGNRDPVFNHAVVLKEIAETKLG